MIGAILTLTALCSVSAFAFTGQSAAADPVPGWECTMWPDKTFYLHCGGATVGHYKSAIECVNGRKQICGPSVGDYECNRWPDGTYNLFCGGAFIAKYKNALECIKGKRATCD